MKQSGDQPRLAARLVAPLLRLIPTRVKGSLSRSRILAPVLSRVYRGMGQQLCKVPTLSLPMILDMTNPHHRPYLSSIPPEPHVNEFIEATVKPGWFTIDVGAFAGYYTLLLAHHVGPTGRVTAFDPAVDCCSYISASVQTNSLSHVRVECAAVGSTVGTASVRPQLLDGARSPGSETTVETSPSRGDRIPLVTLDHYLAKESWARLNFVKIDAEGMELEILHGMDEVIRIYHPIILMEMHRSEEHSLFRDFFVKRGYTIRLLGRTSYAEHVVASHDG